MSDGGEFYGFKPGPTTVIDHNYTQDREIEYLRARLAEAEHLILRMAGEDYQRARFYVEKYDLTGERAADSASAQESESHE